MGSPPAPVVARVRREGAEWRRYAKKITKNLCAFALKIHPGFPAPPLGEVELNPLLNHVHFYTEPMRDAKRGDILDFSTVQPPKRKTATYKRASLPPARLAEYRARFQEAKSKRVRRPLIPEPRYDKVY